MMVSVFYALFTFLLLVQPFFLPCLGVVSTKTDSYIPSHGTIEFFASQQHKNNMHWGVSPTHIQLPYERHNRCTQKKSSKKKSKKSEQRKQEVQCTQQSSYVETTADKQKNYQQLCKQVEANFQGQYHEFKQYCEYEYGDCSQELYTVLNRSSRLEKRFAALQNIEHAGAHYAHYNHLLTQEVVTNVKALGYDVDSYKFCYGNQIQQVIHEDCITLFQETMKIPVSSVMYSRVSAITDCIDAARAYNQAADCIKACTIQDFCWSLFEYGKAVAEGAVWGAVGAVQDCLQHPLHTAACVIIPKGVLVYQLSKVLVNIADIGVTYLFDKEKGQRKLHDYIAPLTQIIHAIQNKQLSGPEIVRGTTQLAIHWKAQSKLLSGLSKLYTTSKTKLEQFIKENPFAAPEQYMTTPEGLLLRVSEESCASKVVSNNNRQVSELLVHQGTNAVLRNGYYEVNGFKFSQHYYEKLWSIKGGRPAPSLIAGEVLKYSKEALADHKPGFFRYEVSDWEMIYNPVTKEVWHLQPLRNKK